MKCNNFEAFDVYILYARDNMQVRDGSADVVI